MKFIITFVYMDAEKFDIEVAEGDMEGFIEAVGKAEVFFNTSAGIGIFIPIDKVRYFSVERVDAEGRRIVASNGAVSNREAETGLTEAGTCIEGGGGLAGTLPALESESKLVEEYDGTGGRRFEELPSSPVPSFGGYPRASEEHDGRGPG